MIVFTIDVLRELIANGKIRENDPIINVIKERLKDSYCKQIPPLNTETTHICLMIDRIFEEEFNL